MAGVWWIDSVGSLVVVWFLIKEGSEAWFGNDCCCCSLLCCRSHQERPRRRKGAHCDGAGKWGLPGTSSFGPSAAVEFAPIKDWLEIEAGVAPMFSHGRTKWDTDLIFKKPFTLSNKVEFMIDVGPQWTFSPEGTKIGAELAADFMFWPTPDRKYGWFLEPTYSYSFSSGHEQSLSLTAGLLIPIP